MNHTVKTVGARVETSLWKSVIFLILNPKCVCFSLTFVGGGFFFFFEKKNGFKGLFLRMVQ